MKTGFTLVEVVVSLLLLEIAVVAAAGTLVVASRTLAEATHLERAVLEAEGVLDSLAGLDVIGSGSRPYPGGNVEWSVDAERLVLVRVVTPDSTVVLAVASAAPGL